MNICVYGAGAVGGAFAARLHAAGENVTVIARGDHAAAIRERGVVLLSGDARIEARVRCVTDPADAGPQDLVIVTLKGHQLPSVARVLGRMLESGAHVVFAMNGILWWFSDGLRIDLPPSFVDVLDPGGALRAAIPPERIVGAVVNSSNEVIEPGVVLNTSPGRNRLVLGRAFGDAQGPTTARLEQIAAVLARAGIEAPIETNIREAIWNKLALYIGVSPVAALTHRALDVLIADPDAFAMMAGLMRETIAIGERLGFTHRADVDASIRFFADKPLRPSLLQDYERGRPPELAGSILAVEAFARATGMPSPRIAMVATMLRMKAR